MISESHANGHFAQRHARGERKPMTWIQTYTGKAFDLIDPQPEQICIEDIAHALAHICRYTGHSAWHYSVAQHCVLMSDTVEPEHALWALLHDAPEAYVNDLARPLKHAPGMEGYAIIEDRVAAAVMGALQFKPTAAAVYAVKEADVRMLATEARRLLTWPPPREWTHDAEPYVFTIHEWDPFFAESAYLTRFNQLRR